MFRALLRLIVFLVVLVVAGALLFGWWTGGRLRLGDAGTAAGQIDTDHARQVGAAVGEKTAEAASRAEAALADGALTAKIKSKMALDDTVRARSVDVTTSAHVVTISGAVASAAERDRILQLARETNGVTQVIDHLKVR